MNPAPPVISTCTCDIPLFDGVSRKRSEGRSQFRGHRSAGRFGTRATLPPMTPPPALDRRPLVLELGCGGTKRRDDAVGVDLLDLPGVDVVGDALEVLRSLADGSVQAIHSEHFLEHVPDAEAVVSEAARVLESGGTFHAVVPHFSNPHFYSDPTHRTFFGLYTFSYWVRSVPWRRLTPQYDDAAPFTLVEAHYALQVEQAVLRPPRAEEGPRLVGRTRRGGRRSSTRSTSSG